MRRCKNRHLQLCLMSQNFLNYLHGIREIVFSYTPKLYVSNLYKYKNVKKSLKNIHLKYLSGISFSLTLKLFYFTFNCIINSNILFIRCFLTNLEILLRRR